MPLSWNEIKDRALKFSREFADDARENAEDRSFWDGFFEVFGVSRRRLASFQEPVKKLGGAQGFIDLFWKGELIVEHKSRGKSLDKAYSQALDYFAGLKERDLPKRVLVSDFERVRLYELESGETHEFPLADFHKHVGLFGFIAGYATQKLSPEDPVNRRAAERMGRLHDALKAGGYEGHALEVLLVRLLFCLFAEDTGIFQPRKCFQDWIENRTSEDGSDLGPLLARLFQVLNTPKDKRGKTLDVQLAAFEYINGRLFEEALPIADFNRDMREALLDACALDWSQISPAIFGALFQSIMDSKARRNLGAHYTSERNIEKLIRPLFLDELRAEFERVKGNRNRLFEFHKKLRSLTFFDPACGCGNFLVVAYRELRLLELDVLRASRSTSGQRDIDAHSLTQLDVDQFHGIEIEEFPALIAQVALWLTDHQMNLKVSEEFGLYFARIPLKSTPHIVHGNALRLDWNTVLPAERCSYLMGNPPFVGAKFMSDAQRADAGLVFSGIDNSGLLDFVAAWYVKAARYSRTADSGQRTADSGQRTADSGQRTADSGQRELRSYPPTASARASRSACSGAGCWRRACRSSSRIAPFNGAMKRAEWRRFIA
nr:DNA methyltransferase [Nevskia sp.]